MATQALAKGYYLRVQVTPHNYTFSLPEIGRDVTCESMDDVFEILGGGKKSNTGKGGTPTPKGTKSTVSSDWKPCGPESYKTLRYKVAAAPEIYGRAQGDNDVQTANSKVAAYKQGASKVLNRYYEEGLEPDQAMADLINKNSCTVFEIKVFLMHVSDKEIPGIQPSKKDGLYRHSKVVRKFFTFRQPMQNLLNCFAEVLVEPGTGVDMHGRLCLVRADGKTPRTGKAAGYRHFKIETTHELGSDSDQQLAALVRSIYARQRSQTNPSG